MSRETREQRYEAKKATAVRLPFSIATVNFTCDANVGYLARALACFGGEAVHVIGKIPENKELMKYSGTTGRFVDFVQHKTPQDLIEWVRKNEYLLISAELTDKAIDFHDILFSGHKKIMFVVGNETDGVPQEIIRASDIVTFIPMPGIGFCLNTSQTANIIFYEFARQFAEGEAARLEGRPY